MAEPSPPMETWAMLHRAHSRVLAELSRRMEAERGVSVLEHGCLHELNRVPKRRLRMLDLAELLGITPSTATRLIDRLERRGWVSRAPAPGDRRTIHVAITADGRRAYARNNRPFTETVEAAIGGRLALDEMKLLSGLLARLWLERAPSGRQQQESD